MPVCPQLLAITVCCAATVAGSDLPIVGILTLPSIEGLPNGFSYLPSSYVKWIESAGARVAPVRYDAPHDELRALTRTLSGLVFTGGSNDLFEPKTGEPTQYFKTARFLFDLAGDGDNMSAQLPIWGTCLGLEVIGCLVAGDMHGDTFLSYFDAENYSVPLDFSDAASSSRMFGDAPTNTLRDLATLPVTMNEHTRGIAVDSAARLADVRVLATNLDRQGKAFVSALEMASRPIYAAQFHPERPAYEWFADRAVPHSASAVDAMAYFARFFVSEARKRVASSFPNDQAEQDALIYSWQPQDTRQASDYYESTYFFPRLPAAATVVFA